MSEPASPPALVFTDLDGTLLDHETYEWSPAAPVLGRLTAAGIPVCLASSKTAAEMVPLRAAMGLSGAPMICENGAGIVGARIVRARIVGAGIGGADGDAASDRAAYWRLRAALEAVPERLRARFEGFADMGPARIAEVTGLSPKAATAAAARAFSEPGLWSGTEAEQREFLDALAGAGVAGRYGGRFLTLSFGGTKADRMDEIAALYGRPVTIALGDAPNDREMLERADHGIVIANPHGAGLPDLDGEAQGRIRRSLETGPGGWSAEVCRLMSELNIPT